VAAQRPTLEASPLAPADPPLAPEQQTDLQQLLAQTKAKLFAQTMTPVRRRRGDA